MTARLSLRHAAGLVALVSILSGRATPAGGPTLDLPAKLDDAEFWTLSQNLSEPNGTFGSDNLTSNETHMQLVIPPLLERVGTGGVYLGVGPEQNFTYIANLKPKIAFILDIRRGNRDLHLLYKALFELAADRADFVSLLFSRPRPDGLSTDSTAGEIFAAFDRVGTSEALYETNYRRVETTLVRRYQLPITVADAAGIEYVYRHFYRFGPRLTYSSSGSGASSGATYASLMTFADRAGVSRSYLADEDRFRTVKALEAANLIVPVVGNFAGPKALQGIGAWLRERGATVSAYYLSNVEDYLSRQNSWLDFCRNAASLPLTDTSAFIRTGTGYRPAARPPVAAGSLPQPTVPFPMPSGGTGMSASRLGVMLEDLRPCNPR